MSRRGAPLLKPFPSLFFVAAAGTVQLPPPTGGRVDLLIIAGEHSGDQHAAKLVRRLRDSQPTLEIAALGGPELAAAVANAGGLGMLGGALLLTALGTILSGSMIPIAVRDIVLGVVVLVAVIALRERAAS